MCSPDWRWWRSNYWYCRCPLANGGCIAPARIRAWRGSRLGVTGRSPVLFEDLGYARRVCEGSPRWDHCSKPLGATIWGLVALGLLAVFIFAWGTKRPLNIAAPAPRSQPRPASRSNAVTFRTLRTPTAMWAPHRSLNWARRAPSRSQPRGRRLANDPGSRRATSIRHGTGHRQAALRCRTRSRTICW